MELTGLQYNNEINQVFEILESKTNFDNNYVTKNGFKSEKINSWSFWINLT